MSRWRQIHRYFPARALLAGLAYAWWLGLRRRARYALGRSRRRWRVACVPSGEARVVGGDA